MGKLLSLLVVLFTLGITLGANAGPLEDGHAAFDRGDYATAMKLWRPLAERGQAEAQHNLGLMYANGLGVSKDDKLAAMWIRKAAVQGFAKAQFHLGLMYFFRDDPKEAVKWYRLAAEQGDERAQSALGGMYKSGLGVAENHREAVKWYRKAAEQGEMVAQQHLATMYYVGWGVPRDYRESAKWYRKAAEQGYEFAQDSLGWSYFEGRGVPQDNVRAYMWSSLATASFLRRGLDAESATENRDKIAKRLTPAQLAQAQGLARKCQASNYKQCD